MKKVVFVFLFIVMSTIGYAGTTIQYTVKSGESLSTIAYKNNTTVEEIRQSNGLTKNEALKKGKTLKVTMNTNLVKKVTHPRLHIKKKKKNIVLVKAKKSNKIKMKKIVKKKRIVRIKKRKKVRTAHHKKKTISKKLAQVLGKQAKPLASTKVNRGGVFINDILFKSSQPNILAFKSKSVHKAKNIINVAKTKLGRRYVWGAIGQRGTFDCSGFTSYVYRKNGINIPRTSRNQSKFGKFISRNNLKKGDLIFFDTSKKRKGYVNHVGIYLGNGKFIHASSAKKKVVVSNLSRFYAQRYVGARRPS